MATVTQPDPPLPHGFTVPHAHQGAHGVHTAKRIPDQLPFVVHPSWGRALSLGVIVGGFVATLAVSAVAVPMLLTGGMPRTGPNIVTGLVIFVAVMAMFAVPMTLVHGSGGPLAACGDNGLWLRVRQVPVKAIFIPWPAIAQIYTRRWGIQKVICVRTHDPRVGTGIGALAAIEHAQSTMFTGTGLIIPTLHSNRRPPEILAAVNHFARGRCHIEAR